MVRPITAPLHGSGSCRAISLQTFYPAIRVRTYAGGRCSTVLSPFSKIKQYFKLDRALHTETTINNTRDFGIGRKLIDLPALRAIGFNANLRLLEVETISQDCTLADGVFDGVTQPQTVVEQKLPRLTFGDPCATALLATLCLFPIPQYIPAMPGCGKRWRS